MLCAAHDAAPGQGDDEAIGRGAEQLGGRRQLPQRAVDDHRDAVGERGGIGEVVGDQQRRDGEGAQLGRQLVAHDAPRVGIERGQRLVEQQDLRLPGQRARQRDPLALAAAEPRRALGGQRRDAQARRAASRPSPHRHPRTPRSRAPSSAGTTRGAAGRSRPTAARAPGRPRARSSARRTTTSPPHAIRPRSGRCNPATARSTVVLPAPDGPTSATTSSPTARLSATRMERSSLVMSRSRTAMRPAACRKAARSR